MPTLTERRDALVQDLTSCMQQARQAEDYAKALSNRVFHLQGKLEQLNDLIGTEEKPEDSKPPDEKPAKKRKRDDAPPAPAEEPPAA